MSLYVVITILSAIAGAGFSYLYFEFGNNPILITALVVMPIIIGYYNTSLDAEASTLRKFIMNFTNILLSYILTGITAMFFSQWV